MAKYKLQELPGMLQQLRKETDLEREMGGVKVISNDANSPIGWRGNGSHKVWIKKRQ